MKLTIKSISEISEFLGKKLSKCYRRFYGDDGEDKSLYEQIDGDILLIFEDDSRLLFQADSESFSLNYWVDPVLNEEEFTLISDRSFWENKIGKEILDIELKMSSYRDNPYGIIFYIGSDTLEISYQTESEHDFDCIIIS